MGHPANVVMMVLMDLTVKMATMDQREYMGKLEPPVSLEQMVYRAYRVHQVKMENTDPGDHSEIKDKRGNLDNYKVMTENCRLG